MVRSGLCWDAACRGGLGFWGANGHDGVWHIALINNLAAGNFDMPVFSGVRIQNYHIGFDLLMSWIVRLTGISTSVLYFQIVPVILAFSVGFLTYSFVKNWKKSDEAGLWATFFVYFGGSFGWLISLLCGQGWGGESMFWSMQAVSTLVNPPFALSLVTILLGLIFWQKYSAKKTWVNFVLASVFFGISIFIKVYAGLLVLTGLLVCGLYSLIINHKSSIIRIFLLSLVLSVILFLPFNKSSAGLISFSPFWFLETMMVSSDRLDWQKMYSAMTTYRMGNIWYKGIPAYFLAFVIFILGNFGTRILAVVPYFKKEKRKLKNIDVFDVFLITVILAGITVPTFFVQKGTPWNTIQFIYYSLFFAGIVAGIVIADIIKNSKFNTTMIRIMVVLLMILTVPTTAASLGNYLPEKPQSTLPVSEKEALDFLSHQPSGIVLTYPFDSEKSDKANPPRPLYLYTSTAYVSAFSRHPTFLEDEMNLDIMRYPWHQRKESIENFLNTLDENDAKAFLKDNNISYVYWLKDQHARVGDFQLGLTRIFENGEVTIFKVN